MKRMLQIFLASSLLACSYLVYPSIGRGFNAMGTSPELSAEEIEILGAAVSFYQYESAAGEGYESFPAISSLTTERFLDVRVVPLWTMNLSIRMVIDYWIMNLVRGCLFESDFENVTDIFGEEECARRSKIDFDGLEWSELPHGSISTYSRPGIDRKKGYAVVSYYEFQDGIPEYGGYIFLYQSNGEWQAARRHMVHHRDWDEIAAGESGQ